MNHNTYSDEYIRDILKSVKSIAVIGASPNADRPSHGVTAFLLDHGYQVFAINPGHAGKVIAGAMTYASLSDLPKPVDMVDVFRASEYLPDIVDGVLSMAKPPKVIWAQLGVRDDAAAARAEKAGLKVVQNRCPKIEIARLHM